MTKQAHVETRQLSQGRYSACLMRKPLTAVHNTARLHLPYTVDRVYRPDAFTVQA